MSDISALLEAIREEAKPGIWTQGVNLSRANAVALEAQRADELELKVKAPGRAMAQTVVLSTQYTSWECDCDGRMDPCEHVVAAVIAASKNDAPLPTAAQRWSRLMYRFFREGRSLRAERLWAHADGSTAPLEESLSALLARPAKGASLHVEPFDLTVDKLFERTTRLPLSPERIEGILRMLKPCRQVFLDGQPIAILDEVVLPLAVVEDENDSIAVTVTASPKVIEVLSPGIALTTEGICFLGETELTGTLLEKLPAKKRYPPTLKAELMTQVLPEMARRIPVEVKTRRLPAIDKDLKPRIHLEIHQLDAGITVLPTLVYGASANARIDNGKLVFLKGKVPLRDVATETRLTHELRETLNLVPGHRMQVVGAEVTRFLDKLRHFRGGLSGDTEMLLGRNARLMPQLNFETLSHTGIPKLGGALLFQVEGTQKTVEAEAVVRAWQEGMGLVPLLEGGFAPLPMAFLDKHGDKLLSLLSARKADGSFSNHALAQVQALCEATETAPPFDFQRLAPLVEGFEKLPPPKLPQDLQASLRPYQLQGVGWLQWLQSTGLGGVLADDMGLGKTLQTLCTLEKGTLVVCPTSVLPNWVAEAKRFRPSMKVSAYHGPQRALEDDADVTVTTYALLRLDKDILSARQWKAVVLDEAQAIKNPDSQVAKAAYGLSADFRLALTGTPVENRLEDLWSLFHFTNPGLLYDRRHFDERIARPISEGSRKESELLRQKIRPFVLRRLKKDVAIDLPPRTESVLHVSLLDSERAVYDAVYAATRADVVKLLDGGGSVMQALEALLRLRQAACHPQLLPGQSAATSSKVQALVEALETAVAEGHKALVFSQWTTLLDLIQPSLSKAGISYTRLDGQTPNRGEVVAEFQKDEGPPVMLLSLKAGGTGLNLTAADHVFLVDPWWNPAVEAQAADRAHRMGQEKPVNIYRLISLGTVEEKILHLQEKKRALFETAFDGQGGATELTKADLLALLA